MMDSIFYFVSSITDSIGGLLGVAFIVLLLVKGASNKNSNSGSKTKSSPTQNPSNQSNE